MNCSPFGRVLKNIQEHNLWPWPLQPLPLAAWRLPARLNFVVSCSTKLWTVRCSCCSYGAIGCNVRGRSKLTRQAGGGGHVAPFTLYQVPCQSKWGPGT